MNRQEKQLVIESIKNDFKNNEASFILGVQGMTVEAIQKLRKELYAKRSALKVAKNTLLKLAAHDVPDLKDLEQYFKEQIAIVFASQEAPAIAKVLKDTAKANEKLVLIAGSLNDKTIRILNKAQIEQLAAMPSREVLLAQVLGTLQAPMSAYVRVLNAIMLKLLWALKDLSKKREQQ